MPGRTTEALIKATLRAWVACGKPGTLEVRKGGVVRIVADDGEAALPSDGVDEDEARCAAAFGVAR